MGLRVLHQSVLSDLPSDGRGIVVLDAGAGRGDLTSQLTDRGYTVDSVEGKPGRFRGHSRRLYTLDLESTAVTEILQRYDVILLIEVLEHVCNPHMVLTNLVALMRPGGLLVLSVPNVESSLAKIYYAFRNQFPGFFDDYSYRECGHLFPISSELMRVLSVEVGLQVETNRTVGRRSPRKPSHTVAALIGMFLGFSSWSQEGLHRVFTLRKREDGEVKLPKYRS